MKIVKKIFNLVGLLSRALSKILIITVCLLPLVVIPLFPRYVDYQEDVKTPEENFVLLFLISTSDIAFYDTGMPENEYPDVYEGQASGLAISSVDGKTYVLTADHFCEGYSEFSIGGGTINFGSILRLYDFEGMTWDAEIVSRSPKYDLCLIETDMPINRNIKIADKMPEIGEDVNVVSAPLGIGGGGIALHFDGKFSGCRSGTCFFTVPAAPGASGSLILNENGEVVGMTQMAAHNLQNLTMGVGVAEIRSFLTTAESELEIDLL